MVYTEGAKKCINILRDVIYVKCVYIILAPSAYIHIYICTKGAKKCINILRDVIYVKCVHIF